MANAAPAAAFRAPCSLRSAYSRWARSCFFRHALAEDALRPEDQERDQHQEGETVLVGYRNIGRAKRFDDAKRQPADDRAGDVAEATDDGRRESLHRDRRSHLDRE